MIQVARQAQRLLGEASRDVLGFVGSKLDRSGGFVDRSGKPDLYYTVFGLDALRALDAPLANGDRRRVTDFLLGQAEAAASMDLVGVLCLARSWASLTGGPPGEPLRGSLTDRLRAHRSIDGGYAISVGGSGGGSAYGCFLGLIAHQSLGLPMAAFDREGLQRCLNALRTDGGGYANDADLRVANAPATAAALTLRHHLGLPIDPASGRYLLQCYIPSVGGFAVSPELGIPDLLTTATTLHGLSAAGLDLEPVAEGCLDLIDALWSGRGAFYAHPAEDEGDLDVEYAWYGLLALGHLSLTRAGRGSA